MVIKSRLSSVMEALKHAAGAAGNLEKIVSVGSKLAKMAAILFP